MTRSADVERGDGPSSELEQPGTGAAGPAWFSDGDAGPARGDDVLLQDGSILISGGGDTTAAAVSTNLLYMPVP